MSDELGLAPISLEEGIADIRAQESIHGDPNPNAGPIVGLAPVAVTQTVVGVPTSMIVEEPIVTTESLQRGLDAAVLVSNPHVVLNLQRLLTQALQFVPHGERNLRAEIAVALAIRPQG